MNSKQKKSDSALKEKRLVSNEKAKKENANIPPKIIWVIPY